jgi:serine/threonine protein kinase
VSIVGRGSYGQVLKARCKTTGKSVAIKLITNLDNDEYDYVKVVREI